MESDPDEMLHDLTSHLGPHCLPLYQFKAFRRTDISVGIK